MADKKDSRQKAGGGLISGLLRLGMIGGAYSLYKKSKESYKNMESMMNNIQSEFLKTNPGSKANKSAVKRFFKTFFEEGNSDIFHERLKQALQNTTYRNDKLPNFTSFEQFNSFMADKKSAYPYLGRYAKSGIQKFSSSSVNDAIKVAKVSVKKTAEISPENFFKKYGAKLGLDPNQSATIMFQLDELQKTVGGGKIRISPILTADEKYVRSASILFTNMSSKKKREYILDFVHNNKVYMGDKSSDRAIARLFQEINSSEKQILPIAQLDAYSRYPELDPDILRKDFLQRNVYNPGDNPNVGMSTIDEYFKKNEVVYYKADEKGPKFNVRPENAPTGMAVSKRSIHGELSPELSHSQAAAITYKNPRQLYGYSRFYDRTGKRSKRMPKVMRKELYEHVGSFDSAHGSSNLLHIRSASVNQDILDNIVNKKLFGNTISKISGDQVIWSNSLKTLEQINDTNIAFNKLHGGDIENILRERYKTSTLKGNNPISFENWLTTQADESLRENPIFLNKKTLIGDSRQEGYVHAKANSFIRGLTISKEGENLNYKMQISELSKLRSGGKSFGANSKVTFYFAQNQEVRSTSRFGMTMTKAIEMSGKKTDIEGNFYRIFNTLSKNKNASKFIKQFRKTGSTKYIQEAAKNVGGFSDKDIKLLNHLYNIENDLSISHKHFDVDELRVIKSNKGIEGFKTADKINALVQDAEIRGAIKASKDNKIKKELSKLGYDLQNNGMLLYSGETRDPISLYDDLEKIVGPNPSNMLYHNQQVGLDVTGELLGFGNRATISRPIWENFGDIFNEKQYSALVDDLFSRTEGYSEDIKNLWSEYIKMNRPSKDLQYIDFNEFIAKRSEYLPDEVGLRKSLMVRLPGTGSNAVVIPTTLFQGGLYIDKNGTNVYGDIYKSFNKVITTAEAFLDNPSQYKDLLEETYQGHLGKYKSVLNDLANDKSIGGKIDGFIGQVRDRVLKDTEMEKIRKGLSANKEFYKDFIDIIGENNLDFFTNPNMAKHIMEGSERILDSLTKEVIGDTPIPGGYTAAGAKYPNYRGSTALGLVIDTNRVLTTAKKHGILNYDLDLGSDTIGVHDYVKTSTFLDLDRDPLHMFSPSSNQTEDIFKDNMRNVKSLYNQQLDISNKQAVLSSGSEKLKIKAGDTFDETAQAMTDAFSMQRLNEFDVSFKQIGIAHNSADILRDAASSMANYEGLVAGTGTKLLQEKILKTASKGASGVTEVNNFITQLKNLSTGQNNKDEFLDALDVLFDAKNLSQEAAPVYKELRSAYGSNLFMEEVQKRGEHLKKLKNISNLEDLIQGGTFTTNKTLKYIAGIVKDVDPSIAKPQALDAIKDAASQTTKNLKDYINPKTALMIGGIAIAANALGGKKEIKVHTQDNNPIMQEPPRSGKAVLPPRQQIVQGQMNTSVNINARINTSKVTQFVSGLENSIGNLRIDNRLDQITPESIRDMVDEKNSNTWNHNKN